MKKTKTSSPSVIIMENLDKKVVRKYKRKIRTPYPITVPEKKILKLLKYTNIKHPKLVKKGLGNILFRLFYSKHRVFLCSLPHKVPSAEMREKAPSRLCSAKGNFT